MTNRTRVVHVNDKVEGAVYVGRAMPRRRLKASPFANPFRITGEWTRELVVDMYEAHMRVGEGRHLRPDLPTLRGKPLACWCRRDGEDRTPDNACHGDVLADLLDRYTDDELRGGGGV